MSATTQTSIVNHAAVLLGATERLNAITDPGNLAKHARAVWALARDTAMADHPWNEFVVRAQLNAQPSAPEFGFERRFALPADCLRWLPPAREDGDAWYEAVNEGGYLLTDAEAPLPVRYISRAKQDDVASWSPHFATYMAHVLAMYLAEPLTQSEGKQDDMANKAATALRRAKKIDALASGPREKRVITARSSWLGARQNPYYPRAR